MSCTLEKNQFILYKGDRGRGVPLKVRHAEHSLLCIRTQFNLIRLYLYGKFHNNSSGFPAVSLSEACFLSHQTPVSHGRSCNPIGHPTAWSGCGCGYPPADSQSESVADTAGKGASHISQRLGSSRFSTHRSVFAHIIKHTHTHTHSLLQVFLFCNALHVLC